MKKIVFILICILAIVYAVFSLLGSRGEYSAERLYYRAAKTIEKIIANPDVIPPAMFASAEKDLQAVMEKYPEAKTAKTAQMSLAEFYIFNKKYDKALGVLDAVIDTRKEDTAMLSKAHFLKANVYERQDKWDKALLEHRILQDKYTKTPVGLQAPLYIGNYYRQKGRDAEADKAYNEAILFYERLEKENRGELFGYAAATFLAQAYMHLERYEEAGKTIEDTINNYPSTSTYIQQMPNVEIVFIKTLNRPEKAIEIYSSIKEKTTDNNLREFLEKRINALRSQGQEIK